MSWTHWDRHEITQSPGFAPRPYKNVYLREGGLGANMTKSGISRDSPPKRGLPPRPCKNHCFWEGDFNEILQIHANRKIYHKTPSHRDLLPDLTNMYVSGKVI